MKRVCKNCIFWDNKVKTGTKNRGVCRKSPSELFPLETNADETCNSWTEPLKGKIGLIDFTQEELDALFADDPIFSA